MSDFETEIEMARLNRDLANIWLDKTNSRMYKIHHAVSTQFESRVVRCVNSMFRQREACDCVVRGAELREVYGYE